MISVATLREYLGLDSAQDALLTTLLAQAVGVVERATGEYYGPQQRVTEVLDGLGSGAVWLNNPATTGELAVIVEIRDWAGTWTVADPTSYELTGRELFRFGDIWPPGQGNLRVTYYRGGGDTPAVVDSALRAIVTSSARDGGEGGIIIKTEVDGMTEQAETGRAAMARDPLIDLPKRPATSRNDSRVTVVAP